MTITGFSNLALKVADLEGAMEWYRALGAQVGTPEDWAGARRVDLRIGPVEVTLFTRALYEEALDLPGECFLHAVFRVADLNSALAGHSVLWGPEVVHGTFGTRRIAFLEAPGAIRIELMEEILGADDGP
ncbi:MAG: hypothetical protein M1115_04445 [Actinobacteria bacterium]|jgi:catechol 2,3-dioxygenase-like lactoylglutathione lyase family enzyme|nr:hypothetical protein [Actinomycetota bacterium]